MAGGTKIDLAMEVDERNRVEAESPEADLRPSSGSMLLYGVPMLVAGLALIVEGIASWGSVAVFAGITIGALGLTFAVLALGSSR
jgi:hypothetical protein